MNEQIVSEILIFLAAITGMSVIGKIVLALVARRKPDPGALADISLRLSRIEAGVEATAIEVERISEAQRFTSRLLSERKENSAP
jgi:hypothetical protein